MLSSKKTAARALQLARFQGLKRPDLRTNGDVPSTLLEQIATPDGNGLKLLRDAADAMRLSARGYHRVLKVARTIADLAGAETVGRSHLAEALAYRALHDRTAAAA